MAKKEKQGKLRERALRKSAGIARRLGEGETVTVRFLFEMDDEDNGWRWLASHYDETKQRTIFYEDDDDIPEGTKNVREAYFTVAFDCDDKKRNPAIDVWELRKSLVSKLITQFEEEYGTMTDRNYKIKRRGTGLETSYDATPMNMSPMSKRMMRAKKESEGLLPDKLDQLLAANG